MHREAASAIPRCWLLCDVAQERLLLMTAQRRSRNWKETNVLAGVCRLVTSLPPSLTFRTFSAASGLSIFSRICIWSAMLRGGGGEGSTRGTGVSDEGESSTRGTQETRPQPTARKTGRVADKDGQPPFGNAVSCAHFSREKAAAQHLSASGQLRSMA